MSNEIDRTLWAGNLSEKITREILHELFLQAGPIDKVRIAKEKDGRPRNYAFITFNHDVSVPYTIQLMDGIPLYGRKLKLQARPGSVHVQQQQQQMMMMQQQPSTPPSYMNMGNANQSQSPMGNPNQPPSPMGNPYMNNMPPMHKAANPYMSNQPMRSQGGPQSSSPHFHRSNTWHGNDLNTQERDHRSDRDRGRDRDRYSNRDRDRSGRRDDYNSPRDNKRGGSNYHNNGRSEDFESKRQRVLQMQGEVLNRYKNQRNSSPQRQSHHSHSNRRGRY